MLVHFSIAVLPES